MENAEQWYKDYDNFDMSALKEKTPDMVKFFKEHYDLVENVANTQKITFNPSPEFNQVVDDAKDEEVVAAGAAPDPFAFDEEEEPGYLEFRNSPAEASPIQDKFEEILQSEFGADDEFTVREVYENKVMAD